MEAARRRWSVAAGCATSRARRTASRCPVAGPSRRRSCSAAVSQLSGTSYNKRVRTLSGLMFFPRGGSAHVARALATELPARGWDVTLVTGSLSGGHGDATAFYKDLDVRPVDFGAGDAPLHPSYEDRPGASDGVF